MTPDQLDQIMKELPDSISFIIEMGDCAGFTDTFDAHNGEITALEHAVMNFLTHDDFIERWDFTDFDYHSIQELREWANATVVKYNIKQVAKVD